MKKLKTLVLVSALGAVVAAVARKLQGDNGGSAQSWQRADPVASPAPTGGGGSEQERYVDNAPSPTGMPDLPDEPVMPDAVGPQALAIDDRPDAEHPAALSVDDAASPGEVGGGAAAPDPLTDPLPDDHDQPRP